MYANFFFTLMQRSVDSIRVTEFVPQAVQSPTLKLSMDLSRLHESTASRKSVIISRKLPLRKRITFLYIAIQLLRLYILYFVLHFCLFYVI